MQYDTTVYNPIAVANVFIELAHKDNVEINAMKLNRLVYLAHGYWLALVERPLLNEYIIAYPYGPMVVSVKEMFGPKYGKDPITDFGARYEIHESPDGEFTGASKTYIWMPRREQDEPAIELINRVWQVYKDIGHIQLTNYCHMIGASPWWEVAKEYQGAPEEIMIPNILIQEYYKGQLQEVFAETQ